MIFDEKDEIITKNLKEFLKTYYITTGISISAIKIDGSIINRYGSSLNFCNMCSEYWDKSSPCQKSFIDACKIASKIGEPYYFFCPLDLIQIAIPLIHEDTLLGGLFAGPILVNKLSEEIITSINNCNLPSDISDDLMTNLQNIPMTDTLKIKYLGDLLFMSASYQMRSCHRVLDERNQRMKQQSRINEQMQLYKLDSEESYYSYSEEKDLYTKVTYGNVSGAKNILNKLLAFIYLKEGHNIPVIKTRITELCFLLSRAAIEGGAIMKEIMAFNCLLFEDLKKINNLEDISFWMIRVLEYYTESIVCVPGSKNKDIIKKAITYINANYTKPIKLKDVAEHVRLNSSYFSTLFKKEVKISFADFVKKIRIEESKYQLKYTQNSIPDIAISVGFSDQSYFTKTFKKSTGLTPRQYRIEYA